MKQRITAEQLNELTDEQKQALREWWKPQEGDLFIPYPDNDCICIYNQNWKIPFISDLPLLSIGQMIQLLESKDQCLNITKRTDIEGWGYQIELRRLKYWNFSTGELCDALWKAVKSIL